MRRLVVEFISEDLKSKDLFLIKEGVKFKVLQDTIDKEPLPFEINKVYTTKFATQEKFEVKEIVYRPNSNKIDHFKGIYLTHPHLGICPLGGDRLIPETE